MAGVAVELFHGWGYSFYRVENRLRADDLLIRAKLSEILGSIRGVVEAAEAAYRWEFLPPPTRDQPRPSPELIRHAQLLETIGRELGMLEGHVRALPVPETDRMTQRFRHEAETLVKLADIDAAMVGHAEFLRALLSPADGPWIIGNVAEVRACTRSINDLIQARADLLNV